VERVLNIKADTISQLAKGMSADFAANIQLFLPDQDCVIVAKIDKLAHIKHKLSLL